MSTASPELDRIEAVLHRAAAARTGRRRREIRTRRGLVAALALACLALTSAALAGVRPIADLIPGLSVTATAPVPSSDLMGVMNASTPLPDSTLQSLAGIGVDLSRLHQAGPPRFGVTVFIAPRTSGGICVVYAQAGTGMTQCGDQASAESGGWISTADGTRLYVGLRPDGVTSVTAEDGTAVPVIGNVYISEQPIRQ